MGAGSGITWTRGRVYHCSMTNNVGSGQIFSSVLRTMSSASPWTAICMLIVPTVEQPLIPLFSRCLYKSVFLTLPSARCSVGIIFYE